MKIQLLIIVLFLTSCETLNKISFEPTYKKNKSNLKEKKNNFYCMVCEKVFIEKIENTTGLANRTYKARYKILERIYGVYKKEFIDVFIYDHRDETPLLNYKNVLLFFHRYKRKFYYEAYQYNDVYMTKSGKWAGTYDEQSYSSNKDTTIFPVKIEFTKPVFYPKGNEYPEYGFGQVYEFKSPYFELQKDSVKAIYGNYVNELFLLKRNSIFKIRGYFD